LTRVAVSGHRALSADIAVLVDAGIKAELERITAAGNTLTGLSCLADGADQIFASAVLAGGGTLEVVVPADQYRDGLPDDAKPTYDRLLSLASAVHKCGYRESTSEAHMDASRFMIDHADHLIAVWDGKPARAYGGTADVVQYAQEKHVPVSVVWPQGASRD
jgi:hypothetical protein